MRLFSWLIAFLLLGCAGPENADGDDPNFGAAGHGGSSAGGSAGSAASGVGNSSAGAGSSAGGNNAGSSAVGGSSAGAQSGGTSGTTGGCKTNGGSAGNPAAGAPSVGEPGVWQNVTPDGIIGTDGVGVQDILVDPVRPSDLYAFSGIGSGVWKSTDYGVSWSLVSTGTLAAELDGGREWTAAIDPNPQRDPETPPTLYTANGYGPIQGALKSTDGGVNWVHYVAAEPGVNIYSLDIDPCDSQHLIAGLHHTPDLVESTDGGETWTRIPTVGSSIYAWFIDTGDAATTRTTWLAISETEAGGALRRTTDSGAHWTVVDSLQHAHGSSELFQEGGIVYVAGVFGSNGSGVYRSADFGATWLHISPDWGQNGVFATSQFLYTHGGGQDPALKKAPRDSDTTWTDMDHPAEMTYCPKRVAVTNDGTHNVIVSGSWMVGIWRYIEP